MILFINSNIFKMFLKYQKKLKNILKKCKCDTLRHYFFSQIDALTKNVAWLTAKEK